MDPMISFLDPSTGCSELEVRMSVPPHDEAGYGPAIVFSHGTMMDRSMFGPQLATLSRSFRVIAFDHRARTAHWRGPYSLDDLARDCLALLDELGIERCILGGMSMGGFMALRLALRHPERLNAMILIDSMASAPLSPNEGFFHALKDSGPLSEAVAQRNADILFGVTTKSRRPELIEAWKTRWRDFTGASVYWETASWLRREDLSSRLSEISVPTLVIHGEEDTIIPIAAGQEMADGVQNGHFVSVANAGHTSNLEDPDAVNTAISDFVESLALR
jgi:pimeloyl-ACP methyl ester carboxylesterase